MTVAMVLLLPMKGTGRLKRANPNRQMELQSLRVAVWESPHFLRKEKTKEERGPRTQMPR